MSGYGVMNKAILVRYEDADAAFMSGAIHSQSNDLLLTHLSGLANQNSTNTGTQHRDIIRGLTINNILLKRHLDQLQEHISSLNRQNSRTQCFVVALTIASLIGTAVQVWYSYRADVKADQDQAKSLLSVPAAVPPPVLTRASAPLILPSQATVPLKPKESAPTPK